MQASDDPFIALASQNLVDEFAALQQRPMSNVGAPTAAAQVVGPSLGRLHGFDLLEQPLVTLLAAYPGQVVAARSTVNLQRAMIGRDVVVLFENGDSTQPIVMGVLEPHPLQKGAMAPNVAQPVQLLVDGERQVIEAEREIVLRCGEASITLTRAGKVIIKGNYILSRSTGYNKIKGAAIDIN